VIDVKIALVDGSYHNVDSSEMAFKIAGSLAFKKGAQEAGLVLLEPYMNMVIKVGKDHVGDVMGDLNSRRGKVMGMDSDAKSEIINAQVPMAEIQTYATDLTSMTGGLGSFTVSFSHYEEVPAQIAEKSLPSAGMKNNGQDRQSAEAVSPRRIPFAVLTLSDKGSRGEREDTSGPYLVGCLRQQGYVLQSYAIIPDQLPVIVDALIDLADRQAVHLIVTTAAPGWHRPM